MAFDLSDEELQATRIMNGTASKEELYERIAELEEIEKAHQKENGELRERIKELEKKIKAVLELIDTRPYTAYTLYGDILYEDDDIRELLEERN